MSPVNGIKRKGVRLLSDRPTKVSTLKRGVELPPLSSTKQKRKGESLVTQRCTKRSRLASVNKRLSYEPTVLRIIYILQERLVDYFLDDTVAACCWVSKQFNATFALWWCRRFGIDVEMGKSESFPSLAIRKHVGFRAMLLCPFFAGYRQPCFVYCSLSGDKVEAQQEMKCLQRFVELHQPSAITVYPKSNNRPEILDVLQYPCIKSFRICALLDFQPGTRKHPKRQLRSGIWEHLAEFTAASPCMFTPTGKRILKAIACGSNLHELVLVSKTMSGTAWKDLLPEVLAPNLRRFEFDGRASLKTICTFLQAHPLLEDLKLSEAISVPRHRRPPCILPSLLSLEAPLSLVPLIIRKNTTVRFLYVTASESSLPRDLRDAFFYISDSAIHTIRMEIHPRIVSVLMECDIVKSLHCIEDVALYLSSGGFSENMLKIISNSFAALPALSSLYLGDFPHLLGNEGHEERNGRRRRHAQFLEAFYRERRRLCCPVLVNLGFLSQGAAFRCDCNGTISDVDIVT